MANSERRPERKLFILIADDDLEDIELDTVVLKDLNIFERIECVNNGKQLLDYLSNCNDMPDIILSDVDMPVMDGLEALSKIKKNILTKRIPVIIYSDNVSEDLKNKALRIIE